METITKISTRCRLGISFIAVSLSLLCTQVASAQKPPLENKPYNEWRTDYKPKLSKTGKHALFQSEGAWLLYSLGRPNRLITRLPSGEPDFSEDGQNIFLKDSLDTLHIYTLREHLTENKITGVSEWAFSPDWICYIKKDDKSLHLYQLTSGQEISYPNVASFMLNKAKTGLAALSSEGNTLRIIQLNRPKKSNEKAFIDSIADYVQSADGSHIAVRTVKKDGQQELSVLDANGSTLSRLSALLVGKGDYRLSADRPWFSPDGSRLFFLNDTLIKAEPDTLNKPITSVQIWHYKDKVLQSMQLNDTDGPEKMTAVYDIGSGRLQLINHSGEDAILTRTLVGNKGYQLIFSKTIVYESGWDERNRKSCWLLSPVTGKRTLVFKDVASPFEVQISPGARFVIWYDVNKHAYFSFEIERQITRKIDLGKELLLDNDEEDPSSAFTQVYGLCGWSKDGSAFFAYDRFDLWQLDPSGKTKPFSITAQWGRKHQLQLRIPENGNLPQPRLIEKTKALLLEAFDVGTKESGFVRVRFNSSPEITILYKGPYRFSNICHYPNVNSYLICRSNEKQAPNLFWSRDMRSFEQLSNFAPEQHVNWLSSSLILLTRKDGSKGNAILYKPEDFDPGRKYPVIVHFYEKNSHNLHKFLWPGLSVGEINIPFYVSNGYLVLIPDIDYRLDSAGRSAFECIQAGIDYLKDQPFVNIKAIGMQGHSFGGYETNYVLTQTGDIAAACSAAGIADAVNAPLSLNLAGVPQYIKYESGQHRKSAPIWEKPEAYIQESPLFFSNRITAPLLIMHNEKDPNVNFEQGLQMYLALRKQRKPVWLLQYPHSGHVVFGPDEQDFSIRMAQFFDHFLKAKPAPIWLSKGIPAARSRIDSGLEYDVK